jgi:NAD(P)-dependent dehydrogenase (short-subunit alcohol dehydrogenase family)
MRICVIDGRGGGIGSRLIERLVTVVGDGHEIVALGTNQAAAEMMTKSGARHVAIGEWAILRTIQEADLILGSLSVVLAGSFLGEVTPDMVTAILQTRARKLLLPLNRVGVEVIGANSHTLDPLIDQTVRRVESILGSAAGC